MPRRHPAPGTPADWLARAKGNLALARQPKPEDGFWEDLGFQAQQAAEKALKAVLIRHGIPFPWSHSIEELLDLMPADVAVSEALREAASLTDFATTSRYPGDLPLVTEEEYKEALRLAERVVAWAEGVVRGTPQS